MEAAGSREVGTRGQRPSPPACICDMASLAGAAPGLAAAPHGVPGPVGVLQPVCGAGGGAGEPLGSPPAARVQLLFPLPTCTLTALAIGQGLCVPVVALCPCDSCPGRQEWPAQCGAILLAGPGGGVRSLPGTGAREFRGRAEEGCQRGLGIQGPRGVHGEGRGARGGLVPRAHTGSCYHSARSRGSCELRVRKQGCELGSLSLPSAYFAR